MHRRVDRPYDHGLPGVSPYYPGGVVSYANLGQESTCWAFRNPLIEEHGAVSPEVAAAMAEGVRERGSTPTSDFRPPESPGPSGGTPEKPVGLVYLGLATSKDPDPPARYRIGSAARHHPAPRVQGGPQLGAVDTCSKTMNRSGSFAPRTRRIFAPPNLGRLRVVMPHPGRGLRSRRRSRSPAGASSAASKHRGELPVVVGRAAVSRVRG